jgi:hypothetical protein
MNRSEIVHPTLLATASKEYASKVEKAADGRRRCPRGQARETEQVEP